MITPGRSARIRLPHDRACRLLRRGTAQGAPQTPGAWHGALGLARIATLELAYVELPGLVEHVVSLPISVNVVPGDEAAGRVPHPTVHSEVLFQEARETKRLASEAFERGDIAAGEELFDQTESRLRDALEIAPPAVGEEIRTELGAIRQMGSLVHDVGAAYVAKLSRDSHHQMNRKRGRASRPEDEQQ